MHSDAVPSLHLLRIDRPIIYTPLLLLLRIVSFLIPELAQQESNSVANVAKDMIASSDVKLDGVAICVLGEALRFLLPEVVR